MKLVDILASELQAWPVEHGVELVTQDRNGFVFGWYDKPPRLEEGYWVFSEGSALSEWRPGNLAMSEDRKEAIVTREQWQAAVDALKAGEQGWNGEGLPPIGTVCEIRGTVGQELRKQASTWAKVEIIAHTCFGGESVAVGVDVSNATLGWGVAHVFRPIRTAEQIAAEERQKGIEDLGNFLSSSSTTPTPYLWEAAQKIYDAGYRKQADQ